MAIQHWQANCPTCERATLHIRNTYDVPHVAHLLVSIFLCGLWLPIWIIHTLVDSLAPGEPWRCQNCGTPRGLFGGPCGGSAAPVAMLPVKPAGPSTRAKCKGDKCPQCGGAMIAGVELGERVYECSGCGKPFEAGVGDVEWEATDAGW